MLNLPSQRGCDRSRSPDSPTPLVRPATIPKSVNPVVIRHALRERVRRRVVAAETYVLSGMPYNIQRGLGPRRRPCSSQTP